MTVRQQGNVASLRLRSVGALRFVATVTINHTGPYDFLADGLLRTALFRRVYTATPIASSSWTW